jgi:hypothetical protein
MPLPTQSPNLNAFAERWVRSVKQECLSKLILFGEGPLARVLTEYSRHHHSERNHQGKGNRLLFPDMSTKQHPQSRRVECHHRLESLLKYLQARRMSILTLRGLLRRHDLGRNALPVLGRRGRRQEPFPKGYLTRGSRKFFRSAGARPAGGYRSRPPAGSI